MSEADLEYRIKQWDFNDSLFISNSSYKQLAKIESHKKKISLTNQKYMTITNGTINKRVLKTESIPSGFRRGLTRKNW